MLTPAEKKGCYRLLDKLKVEELLSLKDTITKRQIAVENRNEATRVIVEYSESAVELLRRKKLRRDLLFQYLADCGVVVPVNSEKHELIRRVLQYWGSAVPSERELQEIESGTSMAAEACQTEPMPRIAAASAAAAAQPPAASADVAVPKPMEDSQPISSKHQLLGETFVRWFYELLNSENPLCSGGDFGPHHFWENCTLKLVSKTPDISEDNYEGSVLVAQRLQALVREELLIFNPNVSAEGVKVRSDPHGLLIIMVCGTIHQHNNCLGIFQQIFGLVRSPLNENTWKVKMTQLQLCSSRVTAVPKLTDSSARELLLPLASSMAVVPHV